LTAGVEEHVIDSDPHGREGQLMRKPFTKLAVAIFSLVSLIHVLRLIFDWQVTISNVLIPMWVSIVGALVAAVLAVTVKKEAKL
jgi:hypothetical protein